MGALSAIFMWFVFGLLVGVIVGFLESWKEIIVHILFGVMIIVATLIVGLTVFSGESSSAVTIQWYEYIGVVSYAAGFLLGDIAGKQYYQEVMEALNG
jgi:hypothetical protein